MTRLHWIVLGMLCAMAGASAQERSTDTPAFRCGPDRREYSATPCADGRTVAVADRRTEDQRRQAEEVARRERALADRMAREREQREKAAPGAAGIGSSASPPAVATGPKKSARKKSQKPKAPQGMKRTS